ncbi:MAG: winged helix-turn-helix transcriptional regulator [Cyclobacteriaceae bacterium]|nr:winged helix-turn-helix transcriptional regulator [Cyclobacteriaceae bacterium]
MNSNTCIRVLADINQIKECREKIKQVNQSVDVLASALSLAGNEVRLKILFLLQEEGQLCPCDLSDILGMTVSAISQHLRKLKDGRLIESKKTGQTIFYSVNADYSEILKPMFKLIANNKILELV